MMQKKILLTALTALLMTTGGGTTIFSDKAQENLIENRQSYTVAFADGLPADYAQVVEAAGGRILQALPVIGGMEAEFQSETAFAAWKKAASPLAVSKESMLPRPNERSDAAIVLNDAEDASLDHYWTAQSDIEKVINGTEDSRTMSAPITAILDTGIDIRRADLTAFLIGGSNLVPAGEDMSEAGDKGDIRDRTGHGTREAETTLMESLTKGAEPQYLRVYRIYSEHGGAPMLRVLAAMVQAFEDGAGSVRLALGEVGDHALGDADRLLFRRAVQFAADHQASLYVSIGAETVVVENDFGSDELWRHF